MSWELTVGSVTPPHPQHFEPSDGEAGGLCLRPAWAAPTSEGFREAFKTQKGWAWEVCQNNLRKDCEVGFQAIPDFQSGHRLLFPVLLSPGITRAHFAQRLMRCKGLCESILSHRGKRGHVEFSGATSAVCDCVMWIEETAPGKSPQGFQNRPSNSPELPAET